MDTNEFGHFVYQQCILLGAARRRSINVPTRHGYNLHVDMSYGTQIKKGKQTSGVEIFDVDEMTDEHSQAKQSNTTRHDTTLLFVTLIIIGTTFGIHLVGLDVFHECGRGMIETSTKGCGPLKHGVTHIISRQFLG